MTENINPSPINTNTIPGHSLPPTPPKQKNQWWKRPIVFLPVITLALGMVIGGAGKPEPEVVEKPVEKIVEKRIEVKTTPPSCLLALDLMEQGFDYLSTSLGQISELDYAGSRATNAKLTDLAPRANAAKAECRAAK